MNKASVVLRCLGFLAGGIALNFWVSCACVSRAILSTRGGMPAGILSGPVGAWPDGSGNWPPPHVSHMKVLGYSTTMCVLRGAYTASGMTEAPSSPDASRLWWRVESGWPMRSFSHTIAQENWHAPVPPGYTPRGRVDDGVMIGGIRWPIRPVWPGFIVNALIYAVPVGLAWYVLAATVIGLRNKVLRGQRGQCTGCGYDRKGLDITASCPECGLERTGTG